MSSNDVCEKCGSHARSEYGFCEDCGARWRLVAIPSNAQTADSAHSSSPLGNLPARFNSLGLVDARPKQVWLAVLLAITTGPLGLFYCTIPGAIAMLIVEIALRVWLGDWSLVIVLPLCGIWAWKAANES